MTETTTHTLDVPGAVLRYYVRPAESGPAASAPTLFMVASPMIARGFASLTPHFTDRTVVTYDPRGAGRSKRTATGESTPEQHADDLHRVIAALGSGPVDVFASSGGGVNALALVARHPEQVRTLVAHEPPLAQVLPDREYVLAVIADMRRTYEREGVGAGMAKFHTAVSARGEATADYIERLAPDPAGFGLPTDDDGARDNVLLGQNLITCTHYQPDFDALRAAPTRIVLGVGAESEGEMAYRAAVAVAERLGDKPVVFPGNHVGFLGGEFGMHGDPEGFAATLRQVLAEEC